MDSTSVTAALVSATGSLGLAALAILGAVLGLGVAYFVFRWGWDRLRASIATDRYLAMSRWRRGLYAQNARLYGQSQNSELDSLGVKVQTSTYFADRNH